MVRQAIEQSRGTGLLANCSSEAAVPARGEKKNDSLGDMGVDLCVQRLQALSG